MKKPAHILVIRLSAMGDVAMLVPVLRVLTASYPDLKITVLTKAFFIPLFDDIPNLNILKADVKGTHKGFFGLLRLAKDAKKLGVTHIADTHHVLRSTIVRRILWIQGKKTRAIDKGRAEKKHLIQTQGGALHPLKKTHQRYADVFAALGYPIELASHKFPKRKVLSHDLQNLVGSAPKKIIGVAPFAAHTGKMYPLFLMKEVLEHLSISGMYHIFLFGGNSEKQELDSLANAVRGVKNLAGKLAFTEELALIANLDLMLAMDSGNGHLAALYNIPVITLWGVTHPYTGFVPFNQPNEHQLVADRTQFPLVPTSVYGNKYPLGYEKAIETIPPSVVVEKVLAVL